MTIDVKFNDSGREPSQKADPRFPRGMTISMARPGQTSCTYNLPYPAPRCGIYSISCNICGLTVAVTVAGRADDPNKITLPCKRVLQ